MRAVTSTASQPVPAEPVASPAASDAPPPPSAVVPATAFGAHGIWTPGVLLMRRLRFAPKMALLMAALLAAIAVPATEYLLNVRDQIAFSAKERDGVRYLRALYPALLASLDVRRDAAAQAAGNAAAPLAQSQAKLQTALDALQREEQALGAALGTQAAWSAVQQAVRAAQMRPEQQAATFDAFSTAPATLIQLAAQACDGSNLTLDPEVHTFYVMDALCFRLPDMMERIGAIRGGGASAALVGTLASTLRDRIAVNVALTQFHKQSIETGLAKTIAERQAVASRINLAPVQQTLADFIQLVRTHVLDTSTLDANQAPAIVTSGNAALEAQREMTDALLPLLDELLAERVATMQRSVILQSLAIATLVLVAAYLAACHIRMQHRTIALLRHHLGTLARRDLRSPVPVIAGADELVMMSGDIRSLREEMVGQLRIIRRAAEQLSRESAEMAAHARFAGPRLAELNAQTLRDMAQRLESAIRRFEV